MPPPPPNQAGTFRGASLYSGIFDQQDPPPQENKSASPSQQAGPSITTEFSAPSSRPDSATRDSKSTGTLPTSTRSFLPPYLSGAVRWVKVALKDVNKSMLTSSLFLSQTRSCPYTPPRGSRLVSSTPLRTTKNSYECKGKGETQCCVCSVFYSSNCFRGSGECA